MEDKNKKIITIATVILLIIAVYLGYLIYKQNQSPDNTGVDIKEGQSGINNGKQPVFDGTDIPEVLKFPTADATEEEAQAHYELAESLAVNSEVIDFTGCVADPLVLQITPGESVTVKNDDDEEYVITYGDLEYHVPANGEEEFAFEFPNGAGLYGYVCLSEEYRPAGMFFVTEVE